VGKSELSYEEIIEGTLEGWSDYRLVDYKTMVALLWFLCYGQNVYSQSGADWTGCSFSQHPEQCLLVARREQEGIPQVAFVTGRTPTDCIQIFHRLYQEDLVQWTRDKFR
jgi:hypothetical protein